MSAKTQQNGTSRQSTKAVPARQSIMFPQGEDLPLFTGQAPVAIEGRLQPQEAFAQPNLIDLRPTLKGAEAKPEDQKPGAT